MLLTTQYLPISQPPLIFLTVLLIILFAPIIMGRLRIPHIIGLVLAGVLIGPYGLHVLERDASFSLFGFVGLFYIMFLAGLEMDMEGLRRSRGRVLLFGVLTFLLPFVLTYFMAVELLGYTQMASLLLGCLMASNTLVAYPIVGRYGLGRHAATTLSVGATMTSLFFAWSRWRRSSTSLRAPRAELLAMVCREVCGLLCGHDLPHPPIDTLVSAPL